MLQSIHSLSSSYSSVLSSFPLYKPTSLPSLSFPLRHKPCISLAGAHSTTAVSAAVSPLEDGPIELPPDTPSIFATTDEPNPLQLSASVLLTGAIAVFLFRSVRRRAKRAKEMRYRSSGAKKTLKEEAMQSLKAIGTVSVEPGKPPSPIQALLGGITAGVIALFLYKFTATVEAALNRQTVSDNFSVRQITITIRTIVNGLCYLATFIFGINSIGLILYSGQLALSALFEDSASQVSESKEEDKPSSLNLTPESQAKNEESRDSDQSSDMNQ